MKNLSYRGYYGSVDFSQDDGVMFGKLLYLRGVLVNYEGESFPALVAAFETAVDDYLASCEAEGTHPMRPFKGSFNVRTGEERHTKVMLAVEKLGIKSLNEFVNRAIDNELERISGEQNLRHAG